MVPSIPSPLIPPPGICREFVFLKKNVANAPRWGQPIRTNPHGGASNARPMGQDQNFISMINDESDNWLADPNGVSNSKDSLDFQDYETI